MKGEEKFDRKKSILYAWLNKARGNIHTLASARKLILISGKIRYALFAK